MQGVGGPSGRAAPRVAVLVSGEGTLLEALVGRVTAGRLAARFVLVVADRPGVPALARALRAGIATTVVRRAGVPADAWATAMDRTLAEQEVELVLLDGFLSVLPPQLVDRWAGRVLNIHPSLLPRHGGRGMYGSKVHEAVLADGDTETGVTVHEVTAAVDAGPIRVQRRIPVRPHDTPQTLRERLRPLEVDALAEAIEGWRPPSRGPRDPRPGRTVP